jgi:diacylglycerol kinase family enzyme
MPSDSARPVLIVNPRSGGGKAAQFDLVAQCRARGIEPILFQPGDDLAILATTAVRDGADALGMAGGDGSQAAVAAVAAEHGLPYVCVPAGTRNHFALDLGIDRNDVVGALDAFIDGRERRIDLGRVNGRVFVNNAAMGVYGAVVQSSAYRDHKVRTVIEMLPELVGPGAEPFDLRFSGRGGREHDTAVLVLVSNNQYAIDPRPQRGTRGGLDGGVLGVVAVTGPPPDGLTEWSTPTFHVDSATAVALGIDGESVAMEPPLVFGSDPLALRVCVPSRRSRRRPVGPRLPPRPKRRSALPDDQT